MPTRVGRRGAASNRSSGASWSTVVSDDGVLTIASRVSTARPAGVGLDGSTSTARAHVVSTGSIRRRVGASRARRGSTPQVSTADQPGRGLDGLDRRVRGVSTGSTARRGLDRLADGCGISTGSTSAVAVVSTGSTEARVSTGSTSEVRGLDRLDRRSGLDGLDRGVVSTDSTRVSRASSLRSTGSTERGPALDMELAPRGPGIVTRG